MKICSACGERFKDSAWRCPVCSEEPLRVDGFPAFAPELATANEGFEAKYFEPLAALEAGNFWFRSRNRLLIWALSRYFPDAENFLEIGCGTGYVLSGVREAFPKFSLAGSEISTAGLGFAAARLPGVELFQMDGRSIPFENEFDVIGAFDVLEHIKEDEAVLSQMHKAVRHRGGGLILTVPQHPFLWSQMDDYAHHARRYRARELRDKVERAGFRILRMTSFVSLLLPLMMLSRLKQQTPEKIEAMSEFKINPLLNAALESTLSVERTMIRAGLSLPGGGSLLLVARRS
jgi:SAM-dependent methyltransferase